MERDKQEDGDKPGWVFKPGGSSSAPQDEKDSPATQSPKSADKSSVEWTASEYIAHKKDFSWYAFLFATAIIIAGFVYLITRDFISTGIILFAAIVFAVAGARKPRVLPYRLDSSGLTVGQRFYPYSQFKSFAILQEGPIPTVVFMPLKRFIPSVDIFIPPDNAESIMSVLTNHLPLEAKKMGLVDTMAHRIRF